MLNFVPVALNEIKQQLEQNFPMPSDFALKDESSAYEIIERVRAGASFLEIPASDFSLVFQLAGLCTDAEFEQLKRDFENRITSSLFDIGWVFCQYNPDNRRAVELFTSVCLWMKANRRKEFIKTLIGHTDLPWEDVFIHAVEIMRIKKLSIEEFCEKYDIIPGTPFHQRLNIVYLSRCDKDELILNEPLLAQLITTSSLEYLRPTIKNYTAQVHYDEMSQIIRDSLVYRLAQEGDDESIGISPNMLQRIRQQRFLTALEGCTTKKCAKHNIYNSIAGKIKNVELLTGGFFSIDFGIYIVLDNNDWEDYSYAYLPSTFNELLDGWRDLGYPEDYWPAVGEPFIASAREVVLGIKKPQAIRLEFADFDVLYTKDLLSFSRY